MNVITRKCINPEILIYEHDHITRELIKIHDYKEFCNLIDRWKIYLVEKYQVKPGQTICMMLGPDIFYYALFFAASELGLIQIIDYPQAFSETDLYSTKMKMFGKIDYIYTGKFLHDETQRHRWMAQSNRDRDLMYGKQIIYLDDFHNYQVQDNNLANTISDRIWATPNSDIIHSCSSGTTGTPTYVINSHRKVYRMAERLGNYYFEKNSRVLHTIMLHHGASACYHFLPGFMFGKEQFIYTHREKDAVSNELIEFINENQINQLFLFLPVMLLDYLKKTDPVNHRVDIVTLYQITPECLTPLKEKNINLIHSPFGDTTIGLGFFVKTVDRHTSSEDYDVTNMGPPLDDFFQFEIRDDRLYAACPELGESWQTSNDKFQVIDGNYYFQGRANQYRINYEWVQLHDIETKVKELFGLNGANILIDLEMQKIYLAIWKENTQAEEELNNFFATKYKNVKINYVLRNAVYEEFFNSRKIDNSKLRNVCRELILKESTNQ